MGERVSVGCVSRDRESQGPPRESPAVPKVLEVACRDDDCRVDMFVVHYGPDADYREGFQCPGCASADSLENLGSN